MIIEKQCFTPNLQASFQESKFLKFDIKQAQLKWLLKLATNAN